MIWREIDNFSSGSVCMVLASKNFDEADYIATSASSAPSPGPRQTPSAPTP